MTRPTDAQRSLLAKLRKSADADAGANDAQDRAWFAVASRALGVWSSGFGAGGAGPHVSPQLQRKFRVCFPLSAHALQCVQTALDVRDSAPWVAVACARVAFEHALTAQWVLLTRDGEDSLVNEMSKKGFVRASVFTAAVNDLARQDPRFAEHALTADEVQLITGERPKSDWSIERLCDRFADTKLFYDIFRDLSGAVHPSFGLITAYWNRTEDFDLATPNARGGLADNAELPRALAVASIWAVYVLEVMRATGTRSTEVITLGEAVGLPVDLRASDQHPELQPTDATY